MVETIKGQRTIEQLKELTNNMLDMSIAEEQSSYRAKEEGLAECERESSQYHLGICVGVRTALSSFLSRDEMQNIYDTCDAKLNAQEEWCKNYMKNHPLYEDGTISIALSEAN